MCPFLFRDKTGPVINLKNWNVLTPTSNTRKNVDLKTPANDISRWCAKLFLRHVLKKNHNWKQKKSCIFPVFTFVFPWVSFVFLYFLSIHIFTSDSLRQRYTKRLCAYADQHTLMWHGYRHTTGTKTFITTHIHTDARLLYITYGFPLIFPCNS